MKKFIPIIFTLLLIFSSCNRKEKSLYDFKTDFVGDNTKVSQIVSKEAYPKNFQTGEIKILSDKEPYGLKVFCKNFEDIEKEDLFENAAISFALIKNLDNLSYVDADEKEIFSFSRAEVEEEELQKNDTSLDKISESQESLENFINK